MWFAPIAVTSPATFAVDRSDRSMTCPAGTSRTILTTAVFCPAREYQYAPSAARPTTSATSNAIYAGLRCLIGNAVPGGGPARRARPSAAVRTEAAVVIGPPISRSSLNVGRSSVHNLHLQHPQLPRCRGRQARQLTRRVPRTRPGDRPDDRLRGRDRICRHRLVLVRACPIARRRIAVRRRPRAARAAARHRLTTVAWVVVQLHGLSRHSRRDAAQGC